MRDAKELRERIEKSRSKRDLQSRLEEATLAHVGGDGEEALGSAADWVQRSRQKQLAFSEKEKQRLAAEQAAKHLDEEDELLSSTPKYTSSDLKGLRVMHGAEDFEAGESMILTLADSSVLSRDENGKILGINDEADVLENINVTEEYKRKQREERKKKASRGAYSGYDDDEFAEGVAPKTQRAILPQYNKEKELGPRMILSDTGVESFGDATEAKDVTSAKRIEENLAIESKALSDYLTPAEYATFNKPKKEKKMRKIRKKEKDLDPYADLVALSADSGEDRGSRSAGTALGKAATTALEEARRREAYNEAVQQAAANNPMQKTAAKKAIDDEDEDDDIQIASALARARQLALQNRNHDPEDGSQKAVNLISKSDMASMAIRNAVGTSDASIISGHRIPKSVAESKDGTEDLNVDVDGRDALGTLYFTDTTEFTSRLQARLYERDREKADAVFKDQANKKRHRDNEDEIAGRKAQRLESNPEDEMDMEIDENSDSDGDAGSEHEEDLDNGFGEKPIAVRGLAATLALLKGSGDLNKKEELAGRVKDAREYDPSAPVGDGGVKIEYRDKEGHKLTQKEAFRQLSYRFHGIEPSRKKKEKTLKVSIFCFTTNISPFNIPRLLLLQALQASSSSGSTKGALDSGTMKFLTQAQEATGKAHIMVQGGAMASSETIAKLAKAKLKKLNNSEKSSSSKK